MQDSSVVVVRRLPSGRWRWHFIDEDSGVSLASNHTYDDPTSAERSANAAYPGLPIEHAGPARLEGAGNSISSSSDAKSGSRWFKFLGLGLVLLVLGALLAPAARNKESA